MLQRIGVIGTQIARLLELAERRSREDARHQQRSDTLEKYSISRDSLRLEKVPIARGGSGVVYRGTYDNEEVDTVPETLNSRS